MNSSWVIRHGALIHDFVDDESFSTASIHPLCPVTCVIRRGALIPDFVDHESLSTAPMHPLCPVTALIEETKEDLSNFVPFSRNSLQISFSSSKIS